MRFTFYLRLLSEVQTDSPYSLDFQPAATLVSICHTASSCCECEELCVCISWAGKMCGRKDLPVDLDDVKNAHAGNIFEE